MVEIKEYVVTNDPYGMLNDEKTVEKTFEDFDTALRAYDAIDNCYDKRITMRSNEDPPSRRILLQVNNGIETCFDIEQYSEKWVTNETKELEKKAQNYLNNKETRIAYCVPALQRFFEVQRAPHDAQSHYRVYDEDLTLVAEGSLNLDKYPDIQDTIALVRTIATTNTKFPYARSVVYSYETLEKEREKKTKERDFMSDIDEAKEALGEFANLVEFDSLSDFQKNAIEIAKGYWGLPLQDKIDVIAKTFGCQTGKIVTSPCTGKWHGTSDVAIEFDNGAKFFTANTLTPKAKTKKYQNECINCELVGYNPEIVKMTKEAAMTPLLKREALDNEIAAQKGLKPYTLLNVEFIDCEDKRADYLGWYYVTLAIDDKIYSHIETGLNHDISRGSVSETPSRRDYFVAGALKEDDVDFVFNNVGHSSKGELYHVQFMSEAALERAKKTLAERIKAGTAHIKNDVGITRQPAKSKKREDFER